MSPAEFYLLARRAADTDDEELWWQVAQGLDNLAAGLDASKAEIARLTKVVERLGSSEAFTTPAVIRNTWEGRELTARLDFARAALKPDTGE